jgi:hypothetical protein
MKDQHKRNAVEMKDQVKTELAEIKNQVKFEMAEMKLQLISHVETLLTDLILINKWAEA